VENRFYSLYTIVSNGMTVLFTVVALNVIQTVLLQLKIILCDFI